MRTHFLLDRTERLFSRGQRALRARKFQEAIEWLQRAIATDPEYPHLYMYLGIARAEVGCLAEAVSDFARAIELEPHNFVFHMELGIRHLDAGAARIALRHLRVSRPCWSTSGTSLIPFELVCSFGRRKKLSNRQAPNRPRWNRLRNEPSVPCGDALSRGVSPSGGGAQLFERRDGLSTEGHMKGQSNRFCLYQTLREMLKSKRCCSMRGELRVTIYGSD